MRLPHEGKSLNCTVFFGLRPYAMNGKKEVESKSSVLNCKRSQAAFNAQLQAMEAELSTQIIAGLKRNQSLYISIFTWPSTVRKALYIPSVLNGIEIRPSESMAIKPPSPPIGAMCSKITFLAASSSESFLCFNSANVVRRKYALTAASL